MAFALLCGHAYLDIDLRGDDTAFKYKGVSCGILCTEDIAVKAANISIVGGMGTTLVHIDSSGFGHIPMNASATEHRP